MFGPFDKFFDLDGDGKLNAFEKGAELAFIDEMEREKDKDSPCGRNSRDERDDCSED